MICYHTVLVNCAKTAIRFVQTLFETREVYDLLPHSICELRQDGNTVCAIRVECRFRSTETVGIIRAGVQDGHLDFHTAPELCGPHQDQTFDNPSALGLACGPDIGFGSGWGSRGGGGAVSYTHLTLPTRR